MRGTQRSHFLGGGGGRFIPAHAGNTIHPYRQPWDNAVHPRACGEHCWIHGVSVNQAGSSPRMRGTLETQGVHCAEQRFIPAHAGNTRAWFAPSIVLPVHPRACGEHKLWGLLDSASTGSSPRMRGTLTDKFTKGIICRFIPAHAGNTDPHRSADWPESVHPRACGEHAALDDFEVLCSGSSPRMRGTHESDRHDHHRIRFIPAHAGNTPGRALKSRFTSVHPRACGEHPPTPFTATALTGSSPRMRGTPDCSPFRQQQGRFIPAHAGNTFMSVSPSGAMAVHPRACGEHQES